MFAAMYAEIEQVRLHGVHINLGTWIAGNNFRHEPAIGMVFRQAGYIRSQSVQGSGGHETYLAHDTTQDELDVSGLVDKTGGTGEQASHGRA